MKYKYAFWILVLCIIFVLIGFLVLENRKLRYQLQEKDARISSLEQDKVNLRNDLIDSIRDREFPLAGMRDPD